MKRPKRHRRWRHQGKAPDYRFSLANERTYLAWIRTSLALLAAAIGIDQLTPDLANPQVRVLICYFLCFCSAGLASFAYLRWASNEDAMRREAPIKYTGFLKVVSVVVLILSLAVILAVAL
ncbi:YidH family protein [Vibrio sp. WXL103]|uniref:YidH family protein n=1 Tax=unclassified Vibrio TaxID=2614977 RepID=UPI003EC8A831